MEQDGGDDTGGCNKHTNDATMKEGHSVEQRGHDDDDEEENVAMAEMEEQPSKEEDKRLLVTNYDDDDSNYSEPECEFDDSDDDDEDDDDEDIYKPEDYEKEDESMSGHHYHHANPEQWQVEAWQRTMFRRYLARLDRNDETLDDLHHQWIGELHSPPWIWTNENLTALGESLIGNTHLESISIPVSAKHTLDFQENDNHNKHNNSSFSLIPGLSVLYRGIEQSQLKMLALIGVYGPLQRTLLEQAKIILPRGPLALTQLWDMPMVQPNMIPMPSTIPPVPFPLITRPHLWSHLTQLHLTDGAWEEPDMAMFCSCLAKHPWLEVLKLSKNHITDVGIAIFCRFWNYDSLIRELDLSGNLISAKGAQQLMQAARLRPATVNLALNSNTNIGYGGLQLVGEELACCKLKYLNVQGCVPPTSTSSSEASESTDAQDAACRALASGLRGNTSLISLCIGQNMLGDGGAQVLIQAAVVHPTLQIFSLAGDTSIGLQGIKYMADELASPASRIKVLGLDRVFPLQWSHWNFDHTTHWLEARAALLSAVQNNFHLTKLSENDTNHLALKSLADFESFLRIKESFRPWLVSDVEFFLGVNESFRPLLASEVMPTAAWPLALAHTIPSYVYFVLQQHPCLVVRKSTNHE